MRYYLDTNILVFLLTKQFDELSLEVLDIVSDYGNIKLTSSVCVHELIQLIQIGKVKIKFMKDKVVTSKEVFEALENAGIEIIHTRDKHLKMMMDMPVLHSDPFDRLIIAQGISDQICVVSSDGKFNSYRKFGLQFVFNRR